MMFCCSYDSAGMSELHPGDRAEELRRLLSLRNECFPSTMSYLPATRTGTLRLMLKLFPLNPFEVLIFSVNWIYIIVTDKPCFKI